MWPNEALSDLDRRCALMGMADRPWGSHRHRPTSGAHWKGGRLVVVVVDRAHGTHRGNHFLRSSGGSAATVSATMSDRHLLIFDEFPPPTTLGDRGRNAGGLFLLFESAPPLGPLGS